jgi:hypothetical protein
MPLRPGSRVEETRNQADSVDFPVPDGPTMAANLPRLDRQMTFFSTGLFQY